MTINYPWFCDVVGTHEAATGADVPGIYRDARGILYHPHEGRDIPLGTMAVERYERPAWTFNKVLYSEKEGIFEILKQERWPEKNDCALLTSKGFASRAARDVLDLMGETSEDILFFLIHDADAYGTSIYQSLQEAAKARAGRTVRVVNLGLEPDEAMAMGLEPEKVESKRKAHAVADYVTDPKWRKWLQTHRIELNAMPTPTLLRWLDTKMERWHNGKVIPPAAVLTAELADRVRKAAREQITERLLREAKVDDLVTVAVDALAETIHAAERDLDITVMRGLFTATEKLWTAPMQELAEKIVNKEE
ncbi:MAG TPA: hypothetical protein VH253_10900 [Phycisphaerae bacterium]|nr:hypothetical protein [Phycisphaerae bacterium]